jgi:hypothetical protein
MSADPFIQDPMKTQGFNRYSYVDNNPLCFTDPTGYFKLKKLFKSPIVRAVVAIAAAAIIGPEVGAWVTSSISTVGATASAAAAAGGLLSEGAIVGIGASAATTGGFIGAAAGGFAAGLITGGSLEAAAKGALISSLFFGVGEITGHGELPFLKEAHIENIAGHAAVGCLQGAIQGGACGPSALSASFGSFIGPLVPSNLGMTGKLVLHTVVGGTTAVLGGGRFANGAITGAFGYLFNGAKGRLVGGLIGAGVVGVLTGPEDIPGELAGHYVGSKIGDWIEDKIFGPDLPKLDASGKVHGEIPNHVPDSWTTEQQRELADDLRISLENRQREQLRLGEDGTHRERMRQEQNLLRQLDKKLGGS